MFGPLSSDESALIARLPRINRAREHYLYASDRTRWLDCWADGGRALMGHRPKGVSLRLKNEIARGLYAPYPSHWEKRLEGELLRLFPGYSGMRIFRSAERASEALELGESPVDPLDLPPAGEGADGEAALWGRPLLPGHPAADFLFPIVPLPGLSDAQPVLFRGGGEAPFTSDSLSPVILAALSRSSASVKEVPRIGIPLISPENADIWERRGSYMMFRGNDGEYRELFETLFSRRVLIAPSGNRGSIIPIGLVRI